MNAPDPLPSIGNLEFSAKQLRERLDTLPEGYTREQVEEILQAWAIPVIVARSVEAVLKMLPLRSTGEIFRHSGGTVVPPTLTPDSSKSLK